MPLMGSLYIGVSGLQTSQNALNTTAHNLSNLESQGYVRQQTLLEDREYHTIGNAGVSAKQTGLGVEYADCRQVRDYFLDLSYREEKGRENFYNVAYETSSEIETLLGEMEGASFNEALGSFWTSIQELQKDPTSSVVQGELVATALQMMERAQAAYQGLMNYQDNLNSRVQTLVDKLNDYGQQIREINDAIKRTEIGVEEANDLRDQRNYILDQMAEICQISYSESTDGVVEVSVEGVPFVARDRVFEMTTEIDDGSGFLTPIWPWNNDAKVYDLNQIVSSDHDTDIGELRGVLVMRGDRRATYTDLSDSTVINGNDYNVYKTGYTDADGVEYMATSRSAIMTTMSEMDRLINSIATTVNDILCGENGVAPKDRYYDYGADEADKLPKEMFVRLGTNDRYKYYGASDLDADHTKEGWYYIDEDTSGAPVDISTMYSVSNLKINPELQKQPTLLSFRTEDKQADQVKADALADAFKSAFGTLNPDGTKEYNYQEYYDAMVSEIGNVGFIYNTLLKSQESTALSLENARQGVIGVSSDEELSNMIKFQNAYNAASRYINAVDAMLAHLIERLA